MEFSLGELNKVAAKILENAATMKVGDRATLVTFSGDLGAGKTTLIQEIARQLGVSETLQSPTYVIYKKYSCTDAPWKYLIHGDMYRLESGDEILKLGWKELLANPDNLVCIEWPEKISDQIPGWAIKVTLTHQKGGELRSVDLG